VLLFDELENARCIRLLQQARGLFCLIIPRFPAAPSPLLQIKDLLCNSNEGDASPSRPTAGLRFTNLRRHIRVCRSQPGGLVIR